MKPIQIIIFFSFLSGIATAQVGVGTTSPNAQLQIMSSNQATPENTDGILIPKIDEFPSNAPTAAQDGMLVFVTGGGTPSKGFYYWNHASTSWTALAGSSEWNDAGSYVTPGDGAAEDVTIGGSDNASARLTVRSDKQIAGLFTNTTVQNGWVIGLNSYLNNNSTAGASQTVGNYNDVINEGQGQVFGDYNRVRGDGSGINYGEYSVLTGSSSGAQNGNYVNISNSGNAVHYGYRSALSGSGSGSHYGLYNHFSGIGTGSKYGVNTVITNAGNGDYYGAFNSINGDGDGVHTGLRNDLSGSGDGAHTGMTNFMSGGGSGLRAGILNLMSGSSSGLHIGTNTNISNTGDGDHYGASHNLNGDGSGAHIGTQNSLTGDGTGSQTGVNNYILNNNNGALIGVSTSISSTGNGTHTGAFNQVSGGTGAQTGTSNQVTGGTSAAPQYGTYNTVYTEGTGNATGTYNSVTGSSTGPKYGTFNYVDTSAGGVHYGIFSQVLKSNSFAGYFLGRVSVGTTGANAYTLPASQGTDKNLMISDASGGSSWVTPAASPLWSITGNTGTGTNFLGTLDAVNLNIGVNGATLLELGSYGYRFMGINGNVSIGSANFAGYGGNNNVMIGSSAGGGPMTGNANVAIGIDALGVNSSGSSNIAVGPNALNANTMGSNNVALGELSLSMNTQGASNIAIGYRSLNSNLSDSHNIAIGQEAIFSKSYGTRNIAIGYRSGYHLTHNAGSNPSRNILIGDNSFAPVSSASNQLNIGNLIYGTGLDGSGYTISSGNIGIGIANPQAKLHVAGSLRITNGTEAAGNILLSDANGTATWASQASLGIDKIADSDGDTQVQVEETANENVIRFDTAGTERMQINSVGSVGIGTTNPQATLHVQGAIRLEATNDTDYWSTVVDILDDYNFAYNGVILSYIQDTDGSYNVLSDRRFKKAIQPIQREVLDKVMQLKPVNYVYTSDRTSRLQHGFIAQEVQKLFPELVTKKQQGSREFLTLNYQAFSVIAIRTIQEQQKEIDLLKEKVALLEQLEERIKKLERN